MKELALPINSEIIFDKAEFYYKNLVKSYKNNLLFVNIEKLIDLNQATSYNSTFFSIINTKQLSFYHIGKFMNQGLGLRKDLLGENGLHRFWKRIHPVDLADLLIVWDKLANYLLFKVSSKHNEHITYTWNYRFKNANEEYINIVENVTPVRCNTHNKSICMLSYCTIINSEINMKVSATANILKNNVYEKISFFNTPLNNLKSKISRREKDIIYLLTLHRSSKEISNNLCISTNTVNTHRRNILKKLKLTSTGELVGLLKNKEYLE